MFCCSKQKTAYEMRISDWSSDGCSSDLLGGEAAGLVTAQFVDAVERHTVEVGANFKPRAARDRIGLGEDIANDEFPVVLAFGVLLQLRVLDGELADGGGQTTDRERAVLAADGPQRELARDDDGQD